MSAVARAPIMHDHAESDVPAQSDATLTRHDASPEVSVAAILAHEGPILVDLDETLYLRNSTEDFIDCAWPGFIALLLLRALDVLKPWRLTGGERTRDVWRVAFIYICLPWTAIRWRQRVVKLAQDFANEPLLRAVKARECSTIIATVGFHPIVRPLISAMSLPHTRVIAARLFSFSDRRRGKLALVAAELEQSLIQRALVVTDSVDDMPLLNVCASPLRVLWPEAKYRRALSNVYLPGQYLTQIKRPGERYIIRGILQEDFAFWALCSLGLAPNPILHLTGLLFLSASFWAIYERGYVSNDLAAVRYETQPKLSATFKTIAVATPLLQPWLWASALGAVAIFALRWPASTTPVDFASWGAVLLCTYGWFELYNRFDKKTRVWMFAGLQFARAAAFVVLVPIAPIAAAALGAHTLAKWMPYYVYRLSHRSWPEIPVYLLRLVFFVVLAALLAATQGIGIVWNFTTLALLLWNLYRARRELKIAFGAATRLDRTSRPLP